MIRRGFFFNAVIVVLVTLVATAGCKKSDDKNNITEHPLKAFVGTYSVTYHDHSTVPGAPPPTDVCDNTNSMTVTLDTITGDTTKLKCVFEASKLYCQSQNNYYWCLSASKNSSGIVSGNGFVEFCADATHITVTSSSLTITGTYISCNVSYTENVGGGGPTLPHNFDFTGTKD